jgi:hypothetical protein
MRAPTKKRTILALGTVLSLGCIIFFSNHPSEPTYQGRSLTKWLEDAWTNRRPNPRTSAAEEQAKEDAAQKAVISIGTNGIPTLLTLLTYKDSPFKAKVIDLFASQSLIHTDFFRDSDRNFLAIIGFTILGTNAQPAFADLVHISQSSTPDQQANATVILVHSLFAGKPPLPLLTNTLHDPRPDVREQTAFMIMKFYPEEASKLQLNKTNSN